MPKTPGSGKELTLKYLIGTIGVLSILIAGYNLSPCSGSSGAMTLPEAVAEYRAHLDANRAPQEAAMHGKPTDAPLGHPADRFWDQVSFADYDPPAGLRKQFLRNLAIIELAGETRVLGYFIDATTLMGIENRTAITSPAAIKVVYPAVEVLQIAAPTERGNIGNYSQRVPGYFTVKTTPCPDYLPLNTAKPNADSGSWDPGVDGFFPTFFVTYDLEKNKPEIRRVIPLDLWVSCGGPGVPRNLFLYPGNNPDDIGELFVTRTPGIQFTVEGTGIGFSSPFREIIAISWDYDRRDNDAAWTGVPADPADPEEFEELVRSYRHYRMEMLTIDRGSVAQAWDLWGAADPLPAPPNASRPPEPAPPTVEDAAALAQERAYYDRMYNHRDEGNIALSCDVNGEMGLTSVTMDTPEIGVMTGNRFIRNGVSERAHAGDFYVTRFIIQSPYHLSQPEYGSEPPILAERIFEGSPRLLVRVRKDELVPLTIGPPFTATVEVMANSRTDGQCRVRVRGVDGGWYRLPVTPLKLQATGADGAVLWEGNEVRAESWVRWTVPPGTSGEVRFVPTLETQLPVTCVPTKWRPE